MIPIANKLLVPTLASSFLTKSNHSSFLCVKLSNQSTMRIFTILFILSLIYCTQLPAQSLYDPNQISLIEITFQDNNWDQILDNYYAAGSDNRLLATVEINGTKFDSVGIRYRGGSTYHPDNVKNPMSIKLDYAKKQDYQGYETLKIGNGAKDPSWLREIMTLDIARNYMEAQQANYASVYVNGNFLGLYSNVESVNSDFWKRRFSFNSDNPRFECSPSYSYSEPPTVPPFGCTLGQGSSFQYLGNGIICYFDHYAIQSPSGWEALRDMTQVLKDNPNNARQVLDLDRFIWMSALNSLLANLDSYLGAGTRNFYIAKMDNGRFAPVPEDMDRSFARFPWTTVSQASGPQPPLSFYAQLDPYLGANSDLKPLLKVIFGNATWKRMYTAHLRTIINEMFSSGWFEQRAAALHSLIGDEVLSDANHFYTYNQFLQNLNSTVVDSYNGEDAYGLIPLMQDRIAYLLSLPEFQATPPGISSVTAAPAAPQPGATVVISASVANATEVMLGYRNSKQDMFELVPMFDDGNHGDGAANDGLFGAQLTIPVGGLQYYIYAENTHAGRFSPQRAEYEYYSLNTFGDVVINELMASNKTTVADQDGQYDDWAEFYNNSSNTVNLSGWYISDNLQQLNKWQLPNGVFLNPGEYLIVWLDGDENQAGLHAPFKLSASGEALALSRPDLSIADQVVFGPQETDISLARCPNGTGGFVKATPTFGADNTPGCLTATSSRQANLAVKIFPNPATTQVRLQAETTESLRFRLLSATGQVMRSGKFRSEVELDISSLPQGLYFVEIHESIRQKLLIIR